MDVPKGVLTLRFWFNTTRVKRFCQCVTSRVQKFWASSCYLLVVGRIIRYPHLKFPFPLECLSHPWMIFIDTSEKEEGRESKGRWRVRKASEGELAVRCVTYVEPYLNSVGEIRQVEYGGLCQSQEQTNVASLRTEHWPWFKFNGNIWPQH